MLIAVLDRGDFVNEPPCLPFLLLLDLLPWNVHRNGNDEHHEDEVEVHVNRECFENFALLPSCLC